MPARPTQGLKHLTGRSGDLGRLLFLVACLGLGVAEVGFREPVGPLPPGGGTLVAIASGASLTVLATWLLVRPGARVAALALAVHWMIALAFTILAAAKAPSNALIWVPASQAGLFALASMAISGRTGPTPSRVSNVRLPFGATLIFYGLVHIFHRALLAALIPAWIPGAPAWPLVTGSIMVIAGIALLAGHAVTPASLAIAAMFASWILLVHLGRLAGDPVSSFEWGFALTALALTGVALLAARGKAALAAARPALEQARA